MLDKIRLLVKEYLSYSLGIRLAIESVLVAVGSSTIIGFLAEYGAVNYALAYGARLPTEGVPYLRYAVTGISLTIFLISVAVLLFLNWALRVCVRQFIAAGKFESAESLSEIPLRSYINKATLPAVAATQALVAVAYLIAPLESLALWAQLGGAFCLALAIIILARNPQWTKWLIVSIFSICIGVFLVASFTPVLYGQALLYARQGGGLPVKLMMNCKDVSPCVNEVSGQLFLRTTDYFLLREPSTQLLKEIPSRSVEGIIYSGEERWGTR